MSMQNYQLQEQNNYMAQSKEQYIFVFKAYLENRGYSVK